MKFMNYFYPQEFWGISTGHFLPIYTPRPHFRPSGPRRHLFFFFFFIIPRSSSGASLEISLLLPTLPFSNHCRCSTSKDSVNFSLTSLSSFRSFGFFCPPLAPHAKAEPTKKRSKRKKMNRVFIVFVNPKTNTCKTIYSWWNSKI